MKTASTAAARRAAIVLLLIIISYSEAVGQALEAGKDWFEAVPETFSPRSGLKAFAHGGRLWVVGGNDGAPRTDVWSGDGISWVRHASEVIAGREEFLATSYKGRIWIIGGLQRVYRSHVDDFHFSDVWASDDGTSWTKSSNSSPMSYTGSSAAELNGKLWVTGGNVLVAGWNLYNSQVFSSSDAVQWDRLTQLSPFPPRRDHATISHDGKLWVIGGRDSTTYFNDVWSSTDGENWTSATLAAQFSPRWGHGYCVFKDRLWIIGGRLANGNPSREIWNSPDGQAWTRVLPDLPFEPGSSLACVALGDELWVLPGGENGVWRTSDGSNWNNVPLMNPGARSGHATFSHDGKIWLMGGTGWDGHGRNDIWNTSDGSHWNCVTRQAPFQTFNYGRVVRYHDSFWLFGNRSVWCSGDDLNWRLISSSAPFPLSMPPVVYNDRIWLFGGNEVYSTNDGTHFVEMPEPDWGTRSDYTPMSIQSQLLIAGGYTHVTYYPFFIDVSLSQDVLHLSEGSSWTLLSKLPGSLAKAEPVVFDRRTWLVGGVWSTYSPGGSYHCYYKTVSHTTDGVNWEGTADVPFTGRFLASLAPLDSRLFMIGGVGPYGRLSEVWFTHGDQDTSSRAGDDWLHYR